MKPITKYSDKQIHLIIIAFFLLMTMIGFELAMYFQYKQPDDQRMQRTRLRLQRRSECEEEDEQEFSDTIKLVA